MREAADVIIASRNISQIGVPAGAVSVAFAHAGEHPHAAELIGAATRSPTVYNTLHAAPQIAALWATSAQALGAAAYQEALDRSAARTYDELVHWLADLVATVSS